MTINLYLSFCIATLIAVASVLFEATSDVIDARRSLRRRTVEGRDAN